MDKDTPIRHLPINLSLRDAFWRLPRKLPEYTYEHALTVTDGELFTVHGVGHGRLREWRRFKSLNPVSNPLTEGETLQLEIDDLRAQLQSREERVSELNGRLVAKEAEVQDMFWHSQKLTYRINQMHKMLDLVRNGLTVPELRRIGFTVDISIPKENAPDDE